MGEDSAQRSELNVAHKAPQLAAVTVGIIGSLMIYGVLQERIMTTPYGNAENGQEPEMFTQSVFLVFNNRVCAFLAAAILVLFKGESLQNVAPIYKYFAVSVSNVLATTCQYDALKYVNFPTQTLGKCAKMIPVMIWGSLINNKRHKMSDYAVALTVTVGATIFLLGGDVSKGSAHADESTSIYGLVLMCGYLGFDGFTSTFQSMMFSSYENMSTYNQMMYVNLCSATLSVVGLLTQSELFKSLDFCVRHPEFMYDATILSAAAVVSQFIITWTIKEFGALIFATIMTTRQFLSILFSCIWFAHPLTPLQWVGTVLIIGALYYNSLTAKGGKHSHGGKKPSKSSHDSEGEEMHTPLIKDASGSLPAAQ